VRTKNVGKIIVGQSAKKRFLCSHEYRDEKMREKISAKQLFQNHTNSASKKCRKKIVWKKCEKTFLYPHEYRDPKGGEKRAKHFFPVTHE